jgi:hypothetical protein
MLTRTRNKLREAEFFLSLANREYQAQLFDKEPDALEFYISAFVSAGRSVTFAMSKDAGRSTEEWTTEWIANLPSADDRMLVRFFNTQRVKTIHRGEMDVGELDSIVSSEEFSREISMGGGAIAFVTNPSATPSPTYKRTELKFKKLAEGSAIAYCQRYTAILTDLVSDFERDLSGPKLPSY